MIFRYSTNSSGGTGRWQYQYVFLEWAPHSYWSPTSRGWTWTFSGRDRDTKLSGSVYVYTKELPHRVGEMFFSDNQYVYCMSHHWVFVFLPNLPDRNKELILYVVSDQMCNCLTVIDGKTQGSSTPLFQVISLAIGETERDVYMKFYINFWVNVWRS